MNYENGGRDYWDSGGACHELPRLATYLPATAETGIETIRLSKEWLSEAAVNSRI
jgi:hypothetical protein